MEESTSATTESRSVTVERATGPGYTIIDGWPRFKLKSEAPQELWQEHLALYRIAHRVRLKQLCWTALEITAKEVENALQSNNAALFIKKVYDLDQDESRYLKEEVAIKAAEHLCNVMSQRAQDLILLSCPLFGLDLVKAVMKKHRAELGKGKVGSRKE